MMIDVPYEYIFLTMLCNARKFGNGSIDIKSVKNYVSKYLELVRENATVRPSFSIMDIIENFNEDGTFDFNNAIKKDDSEIIFVETDVQKELNDFLRTHGELCYTKDGKIFVQSNLKENYLEKEILRMEVSNEIPKVFRTSVDCIDLFRTIGATYVYNEFKKLLKMELQLEKAYVEYISNPTEENKKRLSKHMFSKYLTSELLKNLNEYNVDAIYLTSIDFESDNEISYKQYPIDQDLWESVPHVTAIGSDDLFLDFHQYAIFGDGPIGFKKLESEIDTLYEDKSKDPTGILGLIMPSKKAKDGFIKLFYLKLLCNLDKYIKEHGGDEKLLKYKARLMYSVDTPDDCLFNVDSLDDYYASVAHGMFLDQFLLEFGDEAKFLSGELFFNPDRTYVIQKLLLMKTYYDLSKDQDLYLLFETFEGTPHYEEYRNIVFGDEPTHKL